MRGFDGYLSPTLDPYSRKDAESSSLYCAPTELGAGCAVVGDTGLTKLPFLSGPTDPGPAYSVAALASGKSYDVWAANVGGVATMGVLRWGRPYGSGTYGTGVYGGRQPAILDAPHFGVPVNEGAATFLLSGGGTSSVGARLATYLGSIRVADEGGLLRRHRSYGQARECGIWNRHNQRLIRLKGGDTSMIDPAQVYACLPDWAPFNDDARNHVKVFSGRPVEVDVRYHQATWATEPSSQFAIVQTAVGWNSTSIPSGLWGQRSEEGFNAGGMVGGAKTHEARYCAEFSVGLVKAYQIAKTQGIASQGLHPGMSSMQMGPREIRNLLTAEYMG